MNRRRLLMIACLCGLASGCGADQSDLQNYVAQVEARPAAPIEPIPQIARYTPYTYDAEGRRAPFTPNVPDQREKADNGVAPDIDRAREPLESFPLDALHMVGTISRGNTMYALIQSPDNVIHRVRRGNHLGQNYGQIDAVSENGVVLSEIVPNGEGGYSERPASIAPAR